ncbi:glycine/D-amino acid oxidase-like deaminating enzyme [Spinactinospora alkalitolerans]|uniref:Glycine/D-amino acid oxidase-like deaminating enzyme n=1 Tax=Spinactinospora alkalitolerans TaxID=687207 RepID=A0A852U284_9ACTN|nr:FAD-binding oxidoreductase [Spinactinospora alkalitolerans]NYE50221.1 glycine/D-amino acid oxidase-like deaminating enzyme [Spinactinospora alkalitolerans]
MSGSALSHVPRANGFANGRVSFWFRQTGRPGPRPALPGSADYDVCIVGGGYTGLWTAYYLKKARPGLRIAVLEKEFAGFGASGRNGGWLSAELAGSRRRFAATHGRGAVLALQEEMRASIGEVAAVVDKEGLDTEVVRGGIFSVAVGDAQRDRLHAKVAGLREWGFTEQDLRLLSPEERAGRIAVRNASAATWSPHGARIHPARLALELARAVESLGVDLFEGTAVTELRPRTGGAPACARTDRGTVRAEYVIRATEGFTASLRGARRMLLPMNSSMIVTEPLPAAVWEEIGWQERELFSDNAHTYVYGQRTADDRIAIGGRGVPYLFGSRWDPDGGTHPKTVLALWRVLTRYFPAARHAGVVHTWSGILGVPRDWCSSAGVDHRTGLGWAGGYVGHGVTATNLAGRTLRDLVLRESTELTRLPWVDHSARNWEPEPLRWIGAQGVYALYREADRRENAGLARTSALGRLGDLVSARE